MTTEQGITLLDFFVLVFAFFMVLREKEKTCKFLEERVDFWYRVATGKHDPSECEVIEFKPKDTK